MRRSAARKGQAPKNIRLRSRIVFTLVALGALAVYTFVVTLSAGLNLLQTQSRNDNAGQPTKTLLNVLQAERRQSLVYLGTRHRGAVPGLAELNRVRARTDQTIGEWREKTANAPGSKIKKSIAETSRKLDAVVSARAVVDKGLASRETVEAPYNTAIDTAFSIIHVNAQLDDPDITADGQALISLTRTRELLAREDAELAGTLAEGRLTQGDILRFAQAAGVRANSESDTQALLPKADRARFDALRRGAAYTTVQRLENRVIQQPRVRGHLTVTGPQWQNATQQVLQQYDRDIDLGGDDLLDRATPLAIKVYGKLVFAGVLGVLALIFAVALAVTASRNMLSQFKRLREAAEDLAERRLPHVIERLSRGEKVDVAVEAPPLQFGTDEIGQVGHAFNAVQRVAISSAVAVAEQRESSRQKLLALALRSRALLNRQITTITNMEKRQDNSPAHTADLFALDELTVRGRRQVGNLVLLAGGPSTQIVREPYPLLDVLRGAMSEVEDYQRIQIKRFRGEWVKAYAVENVKSILAELLDNALQFSPKDTDVDVESERVARGIAVSIHDRGLGLTNEQMAAMNEFFQRPPEFLDADRESAAEIKLGHFVVAFRARAASVEADRIQVSLTRSHYGGVTATVLIPTGLFEAAPPDPRTTQPVTAPTEKDALVPVGAVEQPASVGHEGRSNLAVVRWDDAASPEQDPDVAPGRPPKPSTQPDDEPSSDAAPPADAHEADAEETPGGLPIRKPQENLAPALRTEAPVLPEEPDVPEMRDPEEVRRIMGNYQKGTQRGREDGEQANAHAGANGRSAGDASTGSDDDGDE
jgi:signal transduction histidine kinase